MKAQACLNCLEDVCGCWRYGKGEDTLAQVSEAPTALQNDILLLQARLDG